MSTENSPEESFTMLLDKTVACSRYAKHLLETDTDLLGWLRKNHATPCNRTEILELVQRTDSDPCDETGLARTLRTVRRQILVKLILRDLNGLAGLDEVMQSMTALAEICLQQALSCLMLNLTQQYGAPTGEASGSDQELLVIGMGKLGGGELNVSSDIDLIFIYPEEGQSNGSRNLSNHEIFTRLGRRLIGIINEATADGYVFRVDMRLRPYGDSGPLVMSFAALEEYLVTQGREWERYAWIKARVVAPRDSPKITELMKLVRPFVYRKYLDFGAIDSMRKLHAQIRQEVMRRDRLNNIKLGPGGIREIEFTAQVFQLIRGGQNGRLRTLPTRQTLQVLADYGLIASGVAAELDSAYVFLRNLEHRLQYLDDQQTQELPEKPDDRKIIATAMNCGSYDELLQMLDRHRTLVTRQFEAIFGAQTAQQADSQLWRESMSIDELIPRLQRMGYQDPPGSAQRLVQLRNSGRYLQLPELSRQRLDRLVPGFVSLCATLPDPDVTLLRLLNLLDSISRRAAYLAFLAEFPQALERLATMVSASSWASDYLSQHPALLDELLDPREIYLPPQWHEIDQDLQSRLDEYEGDTERQLEILRHVQQEQIFHLLAMDLQGLLPLEKLSDHLSDLADLMLKHALRLAWMTASKRHRDDPRFAIIGYGKLGGRELGYASDLDLIFLYDDDHPDAQEIYSRLAQRINTMLGSYTPSGRLYETDLRLRPNGASGLLVSSIESFSEYQFDHAWVWEHQALTRARFSTGDAQVGAEFEKIRRRVLCKQRDLAALGHEILEMRQKMHDGHPNNSGLFDIKHDSGGMVDIEFIVQYLVLAYSHQHPELAGNIGNLALLKLAGKLGLIPGAIAERTADQYRALRLEQHRLRLNSQSPCRIPQGSIGTEASRELWSSLFGVTR